MKYKIYKQPTWNCRYYYVKRKFLWFWIKVRERFQVKKFQSIHDIPEYMDYYYGSKDKKKPEFESEKETSDVLIEHAMLIEQYFKKFGIEEAKIEIQNTNFSYYRAIYWNKEGLMVADRPIHAGITTKQLKKEIKEMNKDWYHRLAWFKNMKEIDGPFAAKNNKPYKPPKNLDPGLRDKNYYYYYGKGE